MFQIYVNFVEGYAYMYLYKGACEQDLQQQEYTEEISKFWVSHRIPISI